MTTPMGSPAPGQPLPRSARSHSRPLPTARTPPPGILPDVDLPVAQLRELQAQQQLEAEHALRPPVGDNLVPLLVHSTPLRNWSAESGHQTVNQAVAGASSGPTPSPPWAARQTAHHAAEADARQVGAGSIYATFQIAAELLSGIGIGTVN
jgi:hypothetical protein